MKAPLTLISLILGSILTASAQTTGQAADPQQPSPAFQLPMPENPQSTPTPAGAPMMPGMPGIAPAPMANSSWAVNDYDFNRLVAAIRNQTFASNQLPMIQAAGLCGWFTCTQCAVLMNLFDFDDNKLKVVEYLAPHLINPIRCQPIMQSLSFVSDQQKAWRIISAAQP